VLVGVLSDTHGVLPESIEGVFSGVGHIIHAGDIGSEMVLLRLEAIAPVTAVRGNMDRGDIEWRYPDRAVTRLGGYRVLVEHRMEDVIARGIPEGVDVVVTGHTHRPAVEMRDGILYVNPGSAGGRSRAGAGSTAAILDLTGDVARAAIVSVD